MKTLKFLIPISVLIVLFAAGGLWLYGKDGKTPAQIASSVSQSAHEASTAREETPEAVIPASAPSIPAPVATPNLITVNTSTAVTVTVQLVDPTLIPGSVNLLRLGATGTQPTILGVMHDDGLNGDAKANDGIYTLRTTFNEHGTGQISLQVSAAFKGKLQRAISAYVLVTVGSTYKDPISGVSFTSPQFSVTTQATSSVSSSGLSDIDVQVLDPKAQEYISVIGLIVYSNPSKLSLAQWFSSNVDDDNILHNANVFQAQVINGHSALVFVGPVPSEYQDGPVAFAYMISPSGDRVVAITQGQEAQVSDYGYDPAMLLTQLLATFTF
jgi:hypothetical protein